MALRRSLAPCGLPSRRCCSAGVPRLLARLYCARGPALLAVGDVGRATRAFTESEVHAFATLTHDDNPIHDNTAFASGGQFGTPVVHGMLYASMFSAIIGRRSPGAVYLSQSLAFRKPVHVGETVMAEVEVQRVRRAGRLLDFETRILNESGDLVLSGEARVLMPREGGET